MTLEEILKAVEAPIAKVHLAQPSRRFLDSYSYNAGMMAAVREIRALLAQHPNPAQARVAELEAQVKQWREMARTFYEASRDGFSSERWQRVYAQYEALDSAASQSGGKETI